MRCSRILLMKRFPMDKLIISKSLRSFYKNPQQIAHKVLADRMGERDAGNKPGPGDRIPYVYILTNKKKDLQGNKIENPEYIKNKKLKIDYGFYISNQIMKPIFANLFIGIVQYATVPSKKEQLYSKIENIGTKYGRQRKIC